MSLSSRQSSPFSSEFLVVWLLLVPSPGGTARGQSWRGPAACTLSNPPGCRASPSPSWLSGGQPGAPCRPPGDRPGRAASASASLIMSRQPSPAPPEPLTGALVDLVGVPAATVCRARRWTLGPLREAQGGLEKQLLPEPPGCHRDGRRTPSASSRCQRTTVPFIGRELLAAQPCRTQTRLG